MDDTDWVKSEIIAFKTAGIFLIGISVYDFSNTFPSVFGILTLVFGFWMLGVGWVYKKEMQRLGFHE